MASEYAIKYRKKIAAPGIGIRSSATELDSVTPTLTSGSGVPSATEPNGSIYTRTDASNADTAIYVRIGGSWVAMVGAS